MPPPLPWIPRRTVLSWRDLTSTSSTLYSPPTLDKNMASVGVGQAAHTKEEQEQSAQAAHDEAVREDAQVEETYPHGSCLASLTVSLMLSALMVALDTNVIGTAIPTMTTQWNSLNDVGWYAFLIDSRLTKSPNPTLSKGSSRAQDFSQVLISFFGDALLERSGAQH
ncbi:hypothetical protein P171DRAFT_483912 [Karstenula rhodostoma CBS 690.94]|uniref:Major facilitator superfamily (MFS) profile domain-containing protein n=1 Tax=Karstenula rhodostoma CBS 690.94 TaxID=1392251 RepID=A0A9P4PNN3_9PLEO|nr:hypothetical protein P171DRAFT_483912 [Karstenula rhodostoma CBS 690.94]